VPAGSELPLVVEPNGSGDLASLESWIGGNRQLLEQKLLHHGGVLFRGFKVASPEQFERIAKTLEPSLSAAHHFDGPGVRRWLTRHVCETLDSSVTQNANLLTLHNENSFLPRNPSKVMFCCLRAPEVGGETPIVDCRALYKAIPDRVLRRFRPRNLSYSITIPFATVAANCGTRDRAEIEALCKEHGVGRVLWSDNGDMTMVSDVPAAICHPQTREPVWFNRVHSSFPGSTRLEEAVAALYVRHRLLPRHFVGALKFLYWGLRRRWLYGSWNPGPGFLGLEDRAPFPFADQLRLVTLVWKHAVVLRWREGDVLVLDNRLAAHGRMPHKGRREILFSMDQPSFVEAYSKQQPAPPL